MDRKIDWERFAKSPEYRKEVAVYKDTLVGDYLPPGYYERKGYLIEEYETVRYGWLTKISLGWDFQSVYDNVQEFSGETYGTTIYYSPELKIVVRIVHNGAPYYPRYIFIYRLR